MVLDPSYQEVVKDLKKKLLAELKRTDDPRLIDNGRYFEELDKFSMGKKK